MFRACACSNIFLYLCRRMIEQSTIDRVMAAADIVDVVKDFVALRKAGASYKGLCPFHEDRTPSFMVTPAKQLCKCFACGAGGNVVKFVQMHEQLNYPEAIKWLARKYGIEVEESGRTDEQKERSKERESMYVLNEWACTWFEDTLHNDPDGVAIGMTYFRGRGFRDDTIRKFQLGFCPDRRDAMSQAAQGAGYETKYLVNDTERGMAGTGLSFVNDKGCLTDRYRGRVIFPIHSVSGRVVGFGGRVLAKATKGVSQKYVNSPDSIVYNKRRELYGLFQAKQAISKLDCCYLVEGYTDVISMHQAGVENVVASSGTALTTEQIALLHRFTNNVTMLFDGDEAGIHAALRGTDLLLSQGLNIKVLLLPDGEDPDSFARSHRADELRDYIKSHEVDFIRFKTNILMKDCHNDPVKKEEVVKDIVNSIAVIPSDTLRQIYAHECAEQMNLSEAVIVKVVADRRKQSIIPAQTGAVPQTEESAQSAPAQATQPMAVVLHDEIHLAKAIMRWGACRFNSADGQEVSVVEYISEELRADELTFVTPVCNEILQISTALIAEKEWEQKEWENVFLQHANAEISNLAAQAADDEGQLSETQQKMQTPYEERLWEIVPRMINEMKYRLVSEQVNDILTSLHQPEILADTAKRNQLLMQYQDLAEIQRAIGKVLGDRTIIKRARR